MKKIENNAFSGFMYDHILELLGEGGGSRNAFLKGLSSPVLRISKEEKRIMHS